jgi:hypothetical protein
MLRATMALILKPRLERAADGRVAAAIYIDNARGDSLGIVGPVVYGTEHEARSALRRELESHMTGLATATLAIDGIELGRDLDRAFEAIIVDGGDTLLGKLPPGQAESGTWSVADAHERPTHKASK